MKHTEITTGAILLFYTILFSGCFEIKEKIHLKKDGSGHYELHIDFSQSKQVLLAAEVRIRNPLQYGQLVDPFFLMDSLLNDNVNDIKNIWGIKNTKLNTTSNKFIYVLSFDFFNLAALNYALDQCNSAKAYEQHKQYFSYKKGHLIRNHYLPIEKLTHIFNTDQEHARPSEEVKEAIQQIVQESLYVFEVSTEKPLKDIVSQLAFTRIDNRTASLQGHLASIFRGERKLAMDIYHR